MSKGTWRVGWGGSENMLDRNPIEVKHQCLVHHISVAIVARHSAFSEICISDLGVLYLTGMAVDLGFIPIHHHL